MIDIMIVDDIEEIRDYFGAAIAKEADMRVIDTAASGVECVAKLKLKQPHVVLMDIQMEHKTAGIDTTLYIKTKYPDIKVIILTIHEEDEYLFLAFNAGARDYIVKDTPSAQIISAIRNSVANKLMLRSEIAEKIVTEFSRLKSKENSLLYAMNILMKLTNSEFEVLKCVYEGKTYQQVAQERYVSQVTIKSQINSILKKFEMSRMKDVIALMEGLNFDEIINAKKT